MNLLWVAFLIGLMGSLHCVGMCGPLAIAMPSPPADKLSKILLKKILYNVGRILTYCLLGILVGFIGKGITGIGFQQYISIISGCVILIIALSRLVVPHWSFLSKLNNLLLTPINKLIGRVFTLHWGHFLLGFFNGFLPCGFVYVALTASINANSFIEGIFFMLCFGLGTFPLMLVVSLSPHILKSQWRSKLSKFSSYLAILIGIMFIFRGLNLGIPYLSPKIEEKTVICH